MLKITAFIHIHLLKHKCHAHHVKTKVDKNCHVDTEYVVSQHTLYVEMV